MRVVFALFVASWAVLLAGAMARSTVVVGVGLVLFLAAVGADILHDRRNR